MERSTVASYVTTFVVIFTIYCMIMKLLQRQHLYKSALKFKGPVGLPIIGNALLFVGSTEGIMKTISQLVRSYPSPFRLWMGHFLVFLIATPEQLRIVCRSSKAINKGKLMDFMRPWLGTGLLTAPEAKWRVHRKLLTPSFHIKILESFIEIFAAGSMKIVKKLEEHVDGPEFPIYDFIAQYTLHSVCETTMGVSLGADTQINRDYTEASHCTMSSMATRIFSPWIYPDFVFGRTKLGKNQHKYIKFLHDFASSVIENKKKEFSTQEVQPTVADTENNEHDLAVPRHKVFLDNLIQLSNDGKALSDETLREEVDTIIMTGSDTTGALSSFLMLMLVSHPEIQDQIYRELCEIYQDNDSDELQITAEHLRRMTYLDRVIKETMRLFPIVPYIIRRVTEDMNIDDRIIPKGSQVTLAIFDVHRNENYWPDPMKFDPDRFLPEEITRRDPYTYLPFSNGPRNCIGQKYAMLSMKTLVATILWNYVLKKDVITPVKDIRLKMELIMRPVDPITLRIERRRQLRDV